MQCSAAVRAACRKQQSLAASNGGEWKGIGLFCSPKLPHLRTVSSQFCCRLKVLNRLEGINFYSRDTCMIFFICDLNISVLNNTQVGFLLYYLAG